MYVECIIISVGLNKYMIGFSFFCAFFAAKGIIFQTEEIINEMKGPTNFLHYEHWKLNYTQNAYITCTCHAVHFFCSRILPHTNWTMRKEYSEGRMRKGKETKN